MVFRRGVSKEDGSFAHLVALGSAHLIKCELICQGAKYNVQQCITSRNSFGELINVIIKINSSQSLSSLVHALSLMTHFLPVPSNTMRPSSAARSST
jgi:hypothetical protein